MLTTSIAKLPDVNELIEWLENNQRDKISNLIKNEKDEVPMVKNIFNQMNRKGDTPLGVAAKKGDVELFKLLLSVPGINVNQQSKHGDTPLSIAIASEKIAIIKILITHPSVILNRRSYNKKTPHHLVQEKIQTIKNSKKQKQIKKLAELEKIAAFFDSYLEKMPTELISPIKRELLEDPVVAEDGHTYSKEEILRWFENKKVIISPKTGETLSSKFIIENKTLSRYMDISYQEDNIPDCFFCPISHQLFEEPVVCLDDGVTYEKKELENWFKTKNVCFGIPLRKKEYYSNTTLKILVKESINPTLKKIYDEFILAVKKENHDAVIAIIKEQYALKNVNWPLKVLCGLATTPFLRDCLSSLEKEIIESTNELGETILFDAFKSYPLEKVQLLLQFISLSFLEMEDYFLHYPLIGVCFNSDSIAIIKMIINKMTAENFKSFLQKQKSFISHVAHYGEVNLLLVLMEHGVKLNSEFSDNQSSPLTHACFNFDNQTFEMILKNVEATELNKPNIFSQTPLHLICIRNDLSKAKIFFRYYKNPIHAKNKKGRTPLHDACRNNNLELVKLLIDSIPNLENTADDNGLTPLHEACRNNNLKLAKLLIDSIPNLENTADFEKNTPLHYACKAENIELVNLIISSIPHLQNTANQNGETIFDCAVGDLEITKSITSSVLGIDINAKDLQGEPILIKLCKKGDVETVKYLLNFYSDSIDCNLANNNNDTPLSVICFLRDENKSFELAKLLLGKNAHSSLYIKAQNHSYYPIHIAVCYEKPKLVSLFLETGKDIIHLKAKEGKTPLHMACVTEKLSLNVVKQLFSKVEKSNLMQKDENNNTPLNYLLWNYENHARNRELVEAIFKFFLTNDIPKEALENYRLIEKICCLGATKILELLIDKIDPSILLKQSKKTGCTTLIRACEENSVPTVKLLLKHGCSSIINHQTNSQYESKTALHLASENNNLELVRCLLENGAGHSVNLTDESGLTPFHIACTKGNLDIVNVLLPYFNKNLSFRESNYAVMAIACAVTAKSTSMTKFLLDNGFLPYIHYRGKKQRGLIYAVCCYGNLELITLLFSQYELNKQIDWVSQNNKTGLHIAIKKNNLEVVMFLLENGAIKQINQADKWGRTPLHFACQYADEVMARYLIYKGAYRSLDTKGGEQQNTPEEFLEFHADPAQKKELKTFFRESSIIAMIKYANKLSSSNIPFKQERAGELLAAIEELANIVTSQDKIIYLEKLISKNINQPAKHKNPTCLFFNSDKNSAYHLLARLKDELETQKYSSADSYSHHGVN